MSKIVCKDNEDGIHDFDVQGVDLEDNGDIYVHAKCYACGYVICGEYRRVEESVAPPVSEFKLPIHTPEIQKDMATVSLRGEICARCGHPITEEHEAHTDFDGRDIHEECCEKHGPCMYERKEYERSKEEESA